MEQETTLDGILDKKIMIEQPAKGFRVAVDTILLAHYVPALTGEKVLELGCGVGGAMLSLAHRVRGVFIVGLDIQDHMIDLCHSNISRNSYQDTVSASKSDVLNLPEQYFNAFDHVMMNPPYHDDLRHDAPPLEQKKIANTERSGDLKIWIENAHKALNEKGTLTLIHRADRLDEIIISLTPLFSSLEVHPLLPKLDKAAKRIIITAKKSHCNINHKQTIMQPPLVLHSPDGSFTPQVENILRGRAGH